MEIIILFIITIGGLFLIGILLRSFANFNGLIELEYTKHNDEWIEDGRPAGIYSRPPGSTWFGSAFAMWRVSFVWLFRTPKWIEDDVKAMILLKALRKNTLIWNFGAITWFIIFISEVTNR